MVLVEGLKRAGSNLTRESLISAMENLDVDIGGLRVSFSPGSHQGLKKVYFTKVEGGKATGIINF